MAEKDADLQKIKELIEIMKENELVEVEIKHGDDKIFLKRQTRPAVEQAVSAVPALMPEPGAESAPAGGAGALIQTYASQGPSVAEDLVDVKSPIVGTFYATPSPDSESYVEVGSTVEPQTVVCIIEAMKVMNEIKAETSGTIAEILVTNGQAVEYGQVLFRIKPD